MLAARIRTEFATASWADACPCTVSAGVATTRGADVFRRADAALRAAKQAGGDRAVLHEGRGRRVPAAE